MSITADQFTAPLAYHGEGPIWHPSWPGLRFVDMLAGDLVSLDADGRQVDRLHLGTVANVTCSNGLGWSPSGTTAYYIDD